MRKLLILLVAISTVSCSQYQKVLNKGTVEDRYKMATELYDAKKYSKTIPLFEKITPSYRDKPQMERIQFMVADAHYQIKDYNLSSYYFDKFTKNYPKSSKKEEAAYYSALSYYKLSPRYSIDQKETNQAIEALQNFIVTYPSSEYVSEANKLIKELTVKLEKKSFEIAKQYYLIEDYKAAIAAFDNLMSDYLGTVYREEAMFLRFKASNDLALKSVITKKEERLNNAVKAHQKLKRNYPNSKFLEEADKLLDVINKEIELLPKIETLVENGL
ncbi:MAG: outer membrane protein assembly factor BamD [Flavobacteriaceae bacterium]|nr:outer membrane protein assembly factor BamD [Flavobacteriaceae bacterium]